MTIKKKYFSSAKSAFAFLELLASDDHNFIFRGHSNESYLLDTTYKRHTTRPIEGDGAEDLKMMIEAFRGGLAKLGLNPIPGSSNQDWLEYGRHHALPTPALDFSYSPYVALFFAFDGKKRDLKIAKRKPRKDKYVAIYAVNINTLASCWATNNREPGSNEWYKARNDFLLLSPKFFENGFPGMTLKFFPAPSRHNHRMQRQMGCLLYDTVDFKRIGFENLDEFIDKYDEPRTSGKYGVPEPTAFKILIARNCVPEVLAKLELMNIGGGALYMDADGVARDVINMYSYTPKTSLVLGVELDSSSS